MDRRERGGGGRNREIYVHMRYRQGKEDIKMVASASDHTEQNQRIQQHIQFSSVA